MLLSHRQPDDILLRDGETGEHVTTSDVQDLAAEIAASSARLCFLFADLSRLSA